MADFQTLADPTVAVPAGVRFDSDATVYCVQGWGNRVGGFYDPDDFAERIAQGLRQLSANVYRMTSSHEVDASCYLRFALLLSGARGVAP